MAHLRLRVGAVLLLLAPTTGCDPLFHRFTAITPADDSEDQVPPGGVTDLVASVPSDTALDLAWTAPGDDGQTGQVARYVVGYLATASAASITPGTFGASTQVSVDAPTAAAGEPETHLLSGLDPDTSYCVALIAYDSDDNPSTLSNVACAATGDLLGPGAVTGLTVQVNPVGATFELSWTNPTDGDLARVVVLRAAGGAVALLPADGVIPEAGDDIGGAFVAFVGGAAVDARTDDRLANGVEYHYAVLAQDDAGRWGGAATGSGTPQDTTAPAPVTNLALVENAAPTGLRLDWVLPPEAFVGAVVLRSVDTPVVATLTPGIALAVDGAVGNATVKLVEVSRAGFLDTDVTSGTTYHYAVYTVDGSFNYSVGEVASGTVSRPTFSDIQATPPQARLNTVVSITFTSAVALSGDPSVTVAGQIAGIVTSVGLDYTYSFIVTALVPEGNVTINVQGTNLLGLSGSSTGTVLIDYSAPVPGPVLLAPPATAGHVPGTFDLSASFSDGTGSGVAGCEVCIATDGACDAPEWSPAAFAAGSCNATGLTCADGQTLTLNMRAQDAVGNPAAAATALTRLCDAASPSAGAVTLADTDTGTFVSGSFDLSTTFDDGLGAGISACEVCVATDGTCDTEWVAAGVSGDTCTAPNLTCVDGSSLTISVRAQDAVANPPVEAAPVLRTCDAAAPSLGTVQLPPADDTGTFVSGAFTLSTTLADGTGSGVDGCEVCVAGDGTCDTEWTAAGYAAGTCTASGLSCADGSNVRLGLRGVDFAGNTSAASSILRTCDAAGPSAGPATPANGSSTTHTDGTFDLSATFDDALGSGITSCEVCRSTDGTCDTEWSAAGFALGLCSAADVTCTNGEVMTLRMRATDLLDNVGVTAAVMRTCDTLAPSPGPVVPASTATGTHVDGTFDVSALYLDLGSGVAACEVCVAVDGTCDTEWAPAAITAGPRCSATGVVCANAAPLTLNLRAQDAVGNGWVAATPVSRTCDAAGPTAPTLSATTPQFTALALSWTPTTETGSGLVGGATPYVLEYGSSVPGVYDGTGALEGASPLSRAGPTANLTGLPGCRRYYLRVRVQDAVGNATTSNEVSVRTRCMGDGTFALQAASPAAGDAHRGLTHGDFNSDGITDLAVANFTDADSVRVLLGNGAGGRGDGTFAAATSADGGDFVAAIAKGDFDSDGIADLVVANTLDDRVTVLLGNGTNGRGNGTFSTMTSPNVGDAPSALAVGDFNSDGITDVAVANADGGTVSILLGNGSNGRGDGGFTLGTSPAAGAGPSALATGDFNTDGITDIAVASYGTNNTRILLGNGSNGRGSGTFISAAGPATGDGPDTITAGDFNSDGITDLATANETDNNVSVLLGNGSGGRGNGTFVLGSSPAAGTNPYAISSADFNGDGILNLAVANYTSANVRILLGGGSGGRGDGTFAAGTTPSVGPSAHGMVSADFDSNGIADLAVTSYTVSGTVSVLLGNGTGGRGDGGFAIAAAPAAGSNPYAVATGDFNDDGIGDLAVANAVGNAVSVLLGQGVDGRDLGMFVLGSSPGVGNVPHAVTAGDFNTDGITDLAVAGSGSNVLSILLGGGAGGRGDGTFTLGSSPAVGSAPAAVTAGDFNFDGITDLAVANSGGTTLSVLVGGGSGGRGNGTFTLGSSPGVGTSPHAVVGGDFNFDGILDLAVANHGSNTVSVLIGGGTGGRGNGTFTLGSSPAVGANPVALLSGDFDDDRIVDLAVANSAVDTVSVLLGGGTEGRGDGTFALGSSPAVGLMPRAVARGDFNRDGIEDLAVANSSGDSISVLLGGGSGGLGNGTFTLGTSPAVGSGPHALTAGSFDDDGITDLAVVNLADGQVSILLGTGTHP